MELHLNNLGFKASVINNINFHVLICLQFFTGALNELYAIVYVTDAHYPDLAACKHGALGVKNIMSLW